MSKVFYQVSYGQPVTLHADVVVPLYGAFANSAATTGATSIAWSYHSSVDCDKSTMNAMARLASEMNKR
jgi:hypothetical protein